MSAQVQVTLHLRLPRQATGLPLVRAFIDAVLRPLGVTEDDRLDVAVAAAEASANAIRHAHTGDDFETVIRIDGDMCVVEVTDRGVGFVADVPSTPPPAGALSGRGLYLIAQLADWLQVDSSPGRGTTVRFGRQLRTEPVPPSTLPAC